MGIRETSSPTMIMRIPKSRRILKKISISLLVHILVGREIQLCGYRMDGTRESHWIDPETNDVKTIP